MFGRFFLLLMIVPLMELYGMIQVHQYCARLWGSGDAWLILLGSIILAAISGVSLAKRQGLQLIAQAQLQMKQGRMPSQTMLEGLLMLAGAIALIVPGYITDFFGLFLLIPWTRRLLLKSMGRWLGSQVQGGTIKVYRPGNYNQHGSLEQQSGSVEIIDVEPSHRS